MSSPIQDGGNVDVAPALSEAGALILTDDDLNDATNNNFNTAYNGTFTVTGDDDCDASTEAYDEHEIDSYSNAIGDYDYVAFNGTDGECTIDSFCSVIGAYGHDAVSEADGDIGESRVISLRASAPVGVHRITSQRM